MAKSLLTLNAGSSSLKFSVFEFAGEEPSEVCRGQVEGLGTAASFSAKSALPDGITTIPPRRSEADGHLAALQEILRYVEDAGGRAIGAVGHRVVHGGPTFAGPVRIDDTVLATLRELIPLAPLHQPHNLACIDASRDVFPDAVHVACFDTAFHRTQSWLNDTFGLPPDFYDQGVRRYGFHGLSYEHLARELTRIAPDVAEGRVILAHLGNGASMCALRGGRSVCSTMSFTH